MNRTLFSFRLVSLSFGLLSLFWLPLQAPAQSVPLTPSSAPENVSPVVAPPVEGSSLLTPYTPTTQTEEGAKAPPTEPFDARMLEDVTLSGGELEQPELMKMVNTVLSASVVKVREYPIDLPVVLKLVDTQNLPIQRDFLSARLERTLFFRSLSRMLPDVQANYSSSRFNGVIQIFGDQTIPVQQRQVVPQLLGKWVINPGGQDLFHSLAAYNRSREAFLRLDSTRQEQLSEAARRYYDFLAARIQLQNTEAGRNEARTQLALSEARWKAGVGTRLDVMRSASQLAERETEQVNAENRMALAEQDLLHTLNLDPDLALSSAEVSTQPHVLVPLSIPTDALVAHAIAKNPSLLAAAMELNVLSAESIAVLGRIIPTLTLQTYISGTGPDLQTLGVSRFGGLSLQSNLFESLGTAIPLDYHARRLEVKRQQVEVRQRLRDIQSDVIKAFLDSRAAARSILTSRDALASAQEAYRLAMGRFRAGLGINLDVLNAQTALTLARTRITSAILDFNRSQVSLLEALGETSTPNLTQGLRSLPPPPPPPKVLRTSSSASHLQTPGASSGFSKRNRTP